MHSRTMFFPLHLFFDKTVNRELRSIVTNITIELHPCSQRSLPPILCLLPFSQSSPIHLLGDTSLLSAVMRREVRAEHCLCEGMDGRGRYRVAKSGGDGPGNC